MSNDFYNASGYPTQKQFGASSSARSEFALIQAGFDKLPPMVGFGNYIIRVNAGGTALEALSPRDLLTAMNGLDATTADLTYQTKSGMSAYATLTYANSTYAARGSLASSGITGAAESGANTDITGLSGAVINTKRATVSSHATTADIWGAAGNEIDWTGTAICTAFPAAPQAGASRVLHLAAAAAFTAGANMLIDGTASGSTWTGAANDIVTVHAITTTQFRLEINKYDGSSVGGGLRSKLVSFTRDITLASGTQAITGVGFTPTAIEIFSVIAGVSQVWSHGYTDSSKTSSVLSSRPSAQTLDAVAIWQQGDDTNLNYQKATVASFDADGFTLSWVKTGTPGANTIQCRAICYR